MLNTSYMLLAALPPRTKAVSLHYHICIGILLASEKFVLWRDSHLKEVRNTFSVLKIQAGSNNQPNYKVSWPKNFDINFICLENIDCCFA
jgi:hypothetical protein